MTFQTRLELFSEPNRMCDYSEVWDSAWACVCWGGVTPASISGRIWIRAAQRSGFDLPAAWGLDAFHLTESLLYQATLNRTERKWIVLHDFWVWKISHTLGHSGCDLVTSSSPTKTVLLIDCLKLWIKSGLMKLMKHFKNKLISFDSLAKLEA